MPSLLTHLPGVAGADEAGRGPLAGPVFAAAVVLPDGFDVSGINDSKKLSGKARTELEERIKLHSSWTVESVWPEEIDRLNILWASMAAMSRAIARLIPMPQRVIVDGDRVPPGVSITCEAVVKGDSLFACIAAASILAKNARDRVMIELSETYPGYGFERHFGYPTPEHFESLSRLGPCPIHRRSFAPIQTFGQPTLMGFDG